MPDQNKLDRMREVGVRLVDSCLTCQHKPNRFGDTQSPPWGLCKKLRYVHSKYGSSPMPAHCAIICSHHERIPELALDPALSLGEYVRKLQDMMLGRY